MDNIDLTNVPTELLKSELLRRRMLKREEKNSRVCCKNCANRFWGVSHYGSEKWVCSKRPVQCKNSADNPLPYGNGRFSACSKEYEDNCELFQHKGTTKQTGQMSDRFDNQQS